MSQWDDVPSEAPPSYNEALQSPPVPPQRPPATPQRPQNAYSGPPSGSRPPEKSSGAPRPPSRPSGNFSGAPPQQGPSLSLSQGFTRPPNGPNTSSLYSNNQSLPFKYPRGYLCKKCKNTGFKEKTGKPCMDCWKKFLGPEPYNPNPQLPFRYPRRYLCEKCLNTGSKLKNGKPCQDCYTYLAPRNNVSMTYAVPALPFSSGPVLASPAYGPQYGPQYGPGPNRVQVAPGDPRLGGYLCGRCRGSGLVTFLLDQELCPVCGGLGRILNGQPSTGYYV